MTKQLYYENAYQSECSAKVISCRKQGNGFEIVLNQTVFYPEGGGQAGDIGKLDDVMVTNTIEKNGEIVHITSEPLEIEREVRAAIDFERRLHYSTRHSGEHIFSGIIHSMLGYDNVGFHMGEDYVTVDFNHSVSLEQAKRAEEKANDIILSNKRIEIFYPSKKEQENITFRSKKEISENLRIVRIDGADICACCGTHVAYTGEIGIIKVTGIESIRGGSRLMLQIGKDAYEDYSKKHIQIKQISAILSSKPEETAEAVERLVTQNNDLKYRLQLVKDRLIEEIIGKIPSVSKKEVLFLDDFTPEEIRKTCDKLMEKVEIAIVFSGEEENGYSFAVGSKTQDVIVLGNRIKEKFEGRGGGKNQMFQGKVMGKRNQIEEFLQ